MYVLDQSSPHEALLADKSRTSWRSILLLAIAIFLEVLGTVCMKMVEASEWWRLCAYVAYTFSLSLFPAILDTMSLSVAYATWSAVGTALVAAISVLAFEEEMRPRQVAALGGIICSVIVLQAW